MTKLGKLIRLSICIWKAHSLETGSRHRETQNYAVRHTL